MLSADQEILADLSRKDQTGTSTGNSYSQLEAKRQDKKYTPPVV